MFHLLSVALLAKSITADKALIIGDSWAEYSLQTLQEHCEQVTSMVNRGIAGTTAAQWAGKVHCGATPDSLCCQHDGRTCSLDNVSFEETYRISWLSIGGNDFFEAGCSSDSTAVNQIQSNVEQVIVQLQSASPNTKIVLTGYSVPKGPLTWHPSAACSEFRALEPLNQLVKRAAEARNVGFVNVSHLMGGSGTQWSNAEFFRDSIHLNAAGYQRLWGHPSLQTAMECTMQHSVSSAPHRTSLGALLFAFGLALNGSERNNSP